MTNGSGGRDVDVELVFPQPAEDLEVANIRVVIEDAGEADAAARLLASRDFAGVKVPKGTGTIALTVPVPDLTGTDTPTVRVHVDMGGTGQVKAGDYLNPSMVPLTGETGRRYRVQLIRVG